MPTKRTMTRSLLLCRRRGREVMAVRPPLPISQQAACYVSCGSLTAACRGSCICKESCAVTRVPMDLFLCPCRSKPRKAHHFGSILSAELQEFLGVESMPRTQVGACSPMQQIPA